MKNINVPVEQNWWMSDGCYHNDNPTEERRFKPDNVPPLLNSMAPYQYIEKPKPVYISQDLNKHMREILPVDQEHLFEIKNSEPTYIKEEIQMQASENLEKIDYNDPSEAPSHLTDESFTVEHTYIEENVQDLLSEVDAHLIYLRDRLKRMNEYDENVITEKALQKQKHVKAMNEYSSYKKSKNYSNTQTVDRIDHLNNKIVTKLLNEEERPCLYDLECVKKMNLDLQTVERTAGGPHTKMIKQNSQAFRREAKLLPRSALNERKDENFEEYDYLDVKSLHPQDTKANIVAIEETEVELGDERLIRSREQLLKEFEFEKNVVGPDFVKYKSIEDDREEITEVKMQNKNDDDILTETAEVLEQLKTDEEHLRELMEDYQAEEIREPVDKWWELKDETFSREIYQNKLQSQIDSLEGQNKHLSQHQEPGVPEQSRDDNVETCDAGC